jgi:hypothetical protein
MIGRVLRLHADVAVGVLVSLYPWSDLADVVSVLLCNQSRVTHLKPANVTIFHCLTRSFAQIHPGTHRAPLQQRFDVVPPVVQRLPRRAARNGLRPRGGHQNCEKQVGHCNVIM